MSRENNRLIVHQKSSFATTGTVAYVGGFCASPFGMRNFLGVFTNKLVKFFSEFSWIYILNCS